MRTERETESLVVEKLISCGYPKESIIAEYPISKTCRADIVVVDVKTQIPVMLIEVKASHYTNRDIESIMYEQLKRYYSEFNIPLKVVGAYFDMHEGKFRYIDFTDAIKAQDYGQKVDNYLFPTYKELINGAKQKIIKQKEIKQQSSINVLKILCWCILPLICVLALILDAFAIYTFSNHRLIVMGIGMGLTLIPCFKEISVGEISLKREIEEQDE